MLSFIVTLYVVVRFQDEYVSDDEPRAQPSWMASKVKAEETEKDQKSAKATKHTKYQCQLCKRTNKECCNDSALEDTQT